MMHAPDASELLRIDPDELHRWAALARRLEPLTGEVTRAVLDLHREPSLGRLDRCFAAARFAAEIASEPKKTEAVELAEAIGRFAMRVPA